MSFEFRMGTNKNLKGTVPLNYNFIFTRVSTRGAMQYFACEIPKFPVEICISTMRRTVGCKKVTVS